jgi:multisubunit Na+/H+ antiporter MnhF subunit
MIESAFANIVLDVSLVIMVILLPLAGYRALRGSGTADRLLGVDMITTLLTGLVVLLAPVEDSPTIIDLGIVLAALSFVATISIARYISEGRAL